MRAADAEEEQQPPLVRLLQHVERMQRLRNASSALIPCSPSRAAKEGDPMETKPMTLVPVEHITRAILVLRGHKVLLDAELATLYGASTKRFNEQVRRN